MKNGIGNRGWIRAAGTNFGNIRSIGSCEFKPITMESQASNTANTNSKPSDFNTKAAIDHKWKSSNGASVSEWKTIQRLTPDRKKFDWPAVVIVFDIETTGFSHSRDRIIEVAFRDLVGGKKSTFHTLVNPEKVITNANVHGIRTDMVSKPDIPRMKDLIPIMLKFVESRKLDGKPVVFIAHNGRTFDVPFFIREFKRCSFEIPSDWLFVDTLPLARKLVKPDGSKSLHALQQHYEIQLSGPSHRAMQDVNILSMILQKISFELKLSVADLVKYAFKASDITTKHQPPRTTTTTNSRKSSNS